MSINKEKVINELQNIKDYFLAIQEGEISLDNRDLLKNLITVTDSIILEKNAEKKNIKINFG